LQREEPRRSSFLDRARDGDAALRIEVETMPACEGRVESFLVTHALIVAANQLAEVSEVEVAILPSGCQNANDAHPIRPETFTGSFAPGTTLGLRYLIDKELSRGGVCAVFMARDQKLHYTPVLLKIWQQTGRKTWMEKKFMGEIAALARIDHPDVARALDVGEAADGRSYLVMQDWVNPKDHCAIRDSTQRASVSHFLAPFSAIKPEIEKDEVSKQTRLKGKGSALVWEMKLEHR
jgi:hypothetical protein